MKVGGFLGVRYVPAVERHFIEGDDSRSDAGIARFPARVLTGVPQLKAVSGYPISRMCWSQACGVL